MKHKLPLLDIARFEVGAVIEILTNSVPVALWMLFFYFLTPRLCAIADKRQ